jgi:hypothetical protein
MPTARLRNATTPLLLLDSALLMQNDASFHRHVRQVKFFMYWFRFGRLFAAARFNQVQAAELLIENGISVNAVEKHRDTALMITANVMLYCRDHLEANSPSLP